MIKATDDGFWKEAAGEWVKQKNQPETSRKESGKEQRDAFPGFPEGNQDTDSGSDFFKELFDF